MTSNVTMRPKICFAVIFENGTNFVKIKNSFDSHFEQRISLRQNEMGKGPGAF